MTYKITLLFMLMCLFSSAQSIQLVGQTSINDNQWFNGIAIASNGPYVFAAKSGSSFGNFYTIDASNPSSPSIVESFVPTLSSTRAISVAVNGQTTYLGTAGGDIYATNASNPTSLSLLSTISFNGEIEAMDVTSNNLVAALFNFGIANVNNSNTSSLAFTGGYDVSNDACERVATSGATIFALRHLDDNSLWVLNNSNPASPFLLVDYSFSPALSSGSIGISAEMVVAGNYLYIAAAGSNGLIILDISNPGLISEVARYGNGGSKIITDVKIVGNYAYIADENSGIEVLDISTPSFPFLVASQTVTDGLYKLELQGGYIYGVTSQTPGTFYVFSNTLGKDENEFGEEISISPNPSSGNTHLELDPNNEYKSVSIFDTKGEAVYSESIENQGGIDLPTNEFSSGMYSIKIQTESNQKVIKFIKE